VVSSYKFAGSAVGLLLLLPLYHADVRLALGAAGLSALCVAGLAWRLRALHAAPDVR